MAQIDLGGGTTVRTFPAPPRGFDPMTAGPAELSKYGFPSRPEDAEQLNSYNRLFGLMKNNFTYIEPTFEVNPGRRHITSSSHERSTGRIAPDVAPVTEVSPIWSGAAVFPPAGQSFRWIAGDWTIPNLHKVATTGQTYHCDIWIGIDGDPSVASQDLCQVGVQMNVTQHGDALSLNCSAFCGWYPGPEATMNLPVTFGDTVSAVICTTGAGATEATIFMRNLTQGVATSFILHAGMYSNGSPVSLVGDSALWVVGRPIIGPATSLLADYVQLFFSGAVAVSYSPDGSISQVADGGTQTYINMRYTFITPAPGVLSYGVLVAPQVVECIFADSGSIDPL